VQFFALHKNANIIKKNMDYQWPLDYIGGLNEFTEYLLSAANVSAK